jgi:uncharacterized membrane protein YgcG
MRRIGTAIGIASTLLFISLALLLILVPPLLQGAATSSGDPFVEPVLERAVYDQASAIGADVERALEARIDEIELRSGAEVVVYLRVDPTATEESNLQAARALVDRWGIGREGYDDGVVLMVGLEEDLVHGRVSLFAGAGFLRAYLSEDDLKQVIDQLIVPPAREGRLDAGLILAIDAVDAAVTPARTSLLELLRLVNALVGIPGSLVALLLTVGTAYLVWRRRGDDPRLTDSPSILMAGPPAGMTPALATIVRKGRVTGHTLSTLLVDLAGSGRLRFRNLDRVAEVKADDDPEPLTDPAMEILDDEPGGQRLARPESKAWFILRGQGGADGVLTRQGLWNMNERLAPVLDDLEERALDLGWFTELPGPIISRWTGIGTGQMVLGGISLFGAFAIPMSGLTLLGAALLAGGAGTVAFGRAMSKRTGAGAYVDAMLTAYRRTLEKTLHQARNMEQVVAEPTVRMLADTPDRAVVWGYALGLHDEVAEVLARGLADQAPDAPAAYYPAWLGSSVDGGPGGISRAGAFAGGGSIFSGSAAPNIGGMFGALSSIGSSPSSSSSSGGGFSGGGSSGGGGASGSF